jgi:hypothetical protein
LPLLTALSVASLQFKYETVGELASLGGAQLESFVNDGGWQYIAAKIDGNKALLDAGVLPPAVKPTLAAMSQLCGGLKSLDVAPNGDVALGIDFANFDVFALLGDLQ